MGTHEIGDIFHYTSIEEENLLKSLTNFKGDIFFIQELDELYKLCFKLNPINDKKLKIPAFLCTNVHREFYLAFVAFLRLSQSKSFNSLRCSIDSAFTAYYLIKYPEKEDVYLYKLKEKVVNEEEYKELEKDWYKIFCNIKNTIKNRKSDFPLSDNLPELHEFCSIYAHSDALGIMHRYVLNVEKLKVEGKYFDYEENNEDYKKWFGCLLLGFFKIFVMFWNILFKELAGSRCGEIEARIKVYAEKLTIYRKTYPLKELP